MNLKKVRKTLRYESIREVLSDGYVRYEVLPSNPNWPAAYLVLGKDPASGKLNVMQAGVGDWHQHFDQYKNPDRNVGAALTFLSDVVAGRVCLLAEYDARDRYVGGICYPNSARVAYSLHGSFDSGKAVKRMQYQFNREPQIESR
ncbi:MAG: hypothetical protein ACOYXR_09085 [Nitrospirota bacterium]